MRITYVNGIILYIDETYKVIYKRGKLFFIKDNEMISSLNIQQNKKRKIAARIPYLSRLFRCIPRNIIRCGMDDFIISDGGRLYKYSVIEKRLRAIFDYSPGTSNPLNICQYDRGDGIQELVFGDYGGYDSNGFANVYKLSEGLVNKIFGFSKNDIQHIHRVEFDKYRKCYWVFTGDSNDASAIWKLSLDGKNCVPVLKGSQIYRVCVAFVFEEYIIYATDSPVCQNYLFKFNTQTLELEKMAELSGSVIYGISFQSLSGTKYSFATAVEPDSSLPKWRYRITYKLGQGIHDRFSRVYLLDANLRLREIWKAKKDLLPMWLFQFGNCLFPHQNICGKLYFYAQALKCRKNKTVCVELDNND